MNINISELKSAIQSLRAGDNVNLSGYIYTARDAAHKRFSEAIEKNQELPIDIDGAVIYYAGPTPAKPGMVIGSCGPTTSARMDKHSPKLFDRGLCGVIGKGEVGSEVIDAIKRNGAIYFCAIGGAGALYCKCIESCEVIAYNDLGCESVKRLKVENLPVLVAIDTYGGSVFEHNAQK